MTKFAAATLHKNYRKNFPSKRFNQWSLQTLLKASESGKFFFAFIEDTAMHTRLLSLVMYKITTKVRWGNMSAFRSSLQYRVCRN